MTASDCKRQLGTISNAWSGVEDHGILTCSIGIDFTGSHQGFGNLCLDDKTYPDFIASVCEVFGVKDLDDLVGKPCYALRCFDSWGEQIEGLETMDGKRFTLTSWRRKHFADVNDPYHEKVKSIKSRIESDFHRILLMQQELVDLKQKYTDWDDNA